MDDITREQIYVEIIAGKNFVDPSTEVWEFCMDYALKFKGLMNNPASDIANALLSGLQLGYQCGKKATRKEN